MTTSIAKKPQAARHPRLNAHFRLSKAAKRLLANEYRSDARAVLKRFLIDAELSALPK